MNRKNKPSYRAVKRIIDDLMDRSGLGNAWDEIGKEVQQEIVDAWMSIISEETDA